MNAKDCWWCGNVADSGEHIFKKSDIKRAYGNPPYNKNYQPFILNGPNRKKIQGPDSDAGKFLRNLCKNCNNSRSSKYDIAYDKFIDNSKQHLVEIMKTGEMNLHNFFGDNWNQDFKNTIRYYVKHICCRLSNENIPIPINLINYLEDKQELVDARLQFEVRPLNKVFAQTVFNDDLPGFEILNAGNLTIGERDFGKGNISNSYLSWITTDWLSVNYIVEIDINKLREPIIPRNGKLPISIARSDLKLPLFDSRLEMQIFLESYDRDKDQDMLIKFYDRIKR